MMSEIERKADQNNGKNFARKFIEKKLSYFLLNVTMWQRSFEKP